MSDDFTDSESVPTEFDLDSWLDGAQIVQRSVEIYGRPDLIGRTQELERRIELASSAANDEGSLGDSEVSALDEEYASLAEEIRASKSTWYVSGLSSEKADQIKAAHPTPELPAKPTPQQRAEAEAAVAEQNLHWLAAAVVRIEDAQGRVKNGVTYQQMVKLRDRLGDLQMTRLIRASMACQYEEPHVPAPFSRARSGTDRT